MRRTLLASAALALLATGCDGCSSKEKEVPRSDVETIIRKQLHEKGKYTPPVYCPGPLDATVGAQIVCEMPIAGRQYDVTATVTAVDEKHMVDFDIEVATEPRPLPAPVPSSTESY